MPVELNEAASIAAIVGVPISLVGLLLSYFSLKSDISKTNTKVDTLNDIIQLNQKYNSGGAQYHNCTFNSSPLDSSQVEIQYSSGATEGESNE